MNRWQRGAMPPFLLHTSDRTRSMKSNGSARAAWSLPTDPETMKKRVAGRRHWNRLRQLRADLRRVRLARMLSEYPPGARGLQKDLAERLQVSEATVSRDMRKLAQGVAWSL